MQYLFKGGRVFEAWSDERLDQKLKEIKEEFEEMGLTKLQAVRLMHLAYQEIEIRKEQRERNENN